jgi:glycosyltransferase involved in cell wall biosynthesis
VLHVLIAGAGREAVFMKRYADQSGLHRCIHLLGFQPLETLRQYYQMADLFVLPSCIDKYWQEQYGKVLVEAMASGLPVVTTHSGSIDEIVGEAAILVPPSDSYRLSQSIEQLIDDVELRKDLGKRGQMRAEALFVRRRAMERLGEVLNELLA